MLQNSALWPTGLLCSAVFANTSSNQYRDLTKLQLLLLTGTKSLRESQPKIKAINSQGDYRKPCAILIFTSKEVYLFYIYLIFICGLHKMKAFEEAHLHLMAKFLKCTLDTRQWSSCDTLEECLATSSFISVVTTRHEYSWESRVSG